MIRVLYLEDERWQSEGSVSIALQIDFNYDVTNCFTIDEADECLRSHRWDAVILDIGLNSGKALRYEETCFVLLSRIMRGEYESAGNLPTVPIVLASGVWDMTIEMPDGRRPRVAEIRVEHGITNEMCVRKPIDVEQLHGAIQLAIASEGSQSE